MQTSVSQLLERLPCSEEMSAVLLLLLLTNSSLPAMSHHEFIISYHEAFGHSYRHVGMAWYFNVLVKLHVTEESSGMTNTAARM